MIIANIEQSVGTMVSAFSDYRVEVGGVIVITFAFYLFSHVMLNRNVMSEKTAPSIAASLGIFACNMLLPPMNYYGALYIGVAMDTIGMPRLPTSIWDGWHASLVIVVALFYQGFVDYWIHRVLHMKWMWPIHAIHHSDPDVNGFTAMRIHALQGLFTAMVLTFSATLIGVPPVLVGLIGLLMVVHNAYVHFDVDWDHGPFKYLLASPRFHRWHHADTPELYGKNIANIFPIWDVVFGTYHVPGPCHEPMGAKGVPENNVFLLMIFPFTEWARMIRSSFRASRKQNDAPSLPPAE